jgi:hypothetical protein
MTQGYLVAVKMTFVVPEDFGEITNRLESVRARDVTSIEAMKVLAVGNHEQPAVLSMPPLSRDQLGRFRAGSEVAVAAFYETGKEAKINNGMFQDLFERAGVSHFIEKEIIRGIDPDSEFSKEAKSQLVSMTYAGFAERIRGSEWGRALREWPVVMIDELVRGEDTPERAERRRHDEQYIADHGLLKQQPGSERSFDPLAAISSRLGSPAGKSFYDENIDYFRERYGDEATDMFVKAVEGGDVESAREFAVMVVPDIVVDIVSADEKQSVVAYSADGQTEGRITVNAMPGVDVDPSVVAIIDAASSVILNRRHPSDKSPDPVVSSRFSM